MPNSAEPGTDCRRPTGMRPSTVLPHAAARAAVLLATVLLAAACSQSGSGAGTNGPDQAEPVPAPTSAPPTPPLALPEPVAALRTGGFAGVSDRYAVTREGALNATTSAGPVNRQLDPADLGQLRALATDPAFAAEAKAGRTDVTSRCRDAFNYSVTIGSATVSGTDCSGSLAQSKPTMWKIV